MRFSSNKHTLLKHKEGLHELTKLSGSHLHNCTRSWDQWAMSKHLKHSPIDAVDGHGGESKPDNSHVRDTGITDDVLQVGLRHRAQRAVDDVDAGDRADEKRPVDHPVGQQAHAEADDAVGAELHQHAGVQHRDGGRR